MKLLSTTKTLSLSLLVIIAFFSITLQCMMRITTKETIDTSEYWYNNLQYLIKNGDEESFNKIKNYFSQHPHRLTERHYMCDSHDENFTPFQLAVLLQKKDFIAPLVEKKTANKELAQPHFLQYSISNDSISKKIIVYFKNKKQDIDKKIFVKNYHDGYFSIYQLAFLSKRFELCIQLENIGADIKQLLDTEFMQYLMKEKDNNTLILRYFNNNKDLLNQKIYKKNNRCSNHENYEKETRRPFLDISYTPLQLALSLKNPTLAYNLIHIGAKLSNIYDKQMLLALLIAHNHDFSKNTPKELTTDLSLLTKNLSLIDLNFTPLELAVECQKTKSLQQQNITFKSYEIIFKKIVQLSIQDSLQQQSKLL